MTVLRARLRVFLEPCPLYGRDAELAQVSGERGWNVYVLRAGDEATLQRCLDDLAALVGHPLEIVSRAGTTALFEAEHVAEPVFRTFRASGCKVLWPALYRDGFATYQVLAPDRASLRALTAEMERHGPLSIETVTEVDLDSLDVHVPLTGLGRTLTERQLEVLLTAVHAGFYDAPRGVTAAELAERFGISRSTFGEHLRKAERAALTQMAELLEAYPVLVNGERRGLGRPADT